MRIFKQKGTEEVFSLTNTEQEVKTSFLLNDYLLKPEHSDFALQQSFLELFMVSKYMFSWAFDDIGDLWMAEKGYGCKALQGNCRRDLVHHHTFLCRG